MRNPVSEMQSDPHQCGEFMQPYVTFITQMENQWENNFVVIIQHHLLQLPP